MVHIGKPYVSPTQISMLEMCEVKYDFRYIQGIKSPATFNLVEGSGLHRAGEINNLQKIKSRMDLPVGKLVEAAVAEVETKIEKEGLELSYEEKPLGIARVTDSIKDSLAFTLVPLYHAHIAPRIQPTMAEEKILIELPEHTHDLFGVVDVATEDGLVLDLKVTGRSKGQSGADKSMQLTWYHVAYQYKMGVAPTGVGIDEVLKHKKPKTERFLSTRDSTDVDVMLNRINRSIEKINLLTSGQVEPKPASMDHPLCAAKYCMFHPSNGGPCRYVSSRRIREETRSD